jgi:environmental stress-induced protein Ves
MRRSSTVVLGPIAIDSLPSIAWKNGGGTTRTLAVEPEGVGLEEFTWRISLAEIHGSGDFSSFPGIDRTIMLWQGSGVLLHSPAWPTHALTELWKPFRFQGEDEVSCELVGNATTDLNLMVRREVASAAIQARTTEITLEAQFDDVVILCASGSLRLLMADEPKLMLKAGHFLRISQLTVDLTICPEEANTTFLYATISAILGNRWHSANRQQSSL